MVEEARLESVYTPKGYHEFESRSLRNNVEEAQDISLELLFIFNISVNLANQIVSPMVRKPAINATMQLMSLALR